MNTYGSIELEMAETQDVSVSQRATQAADAKTVYYAVRNAALRMFTGLTSRNCPIKSQIGVWPRTYSL